VDTQHLLRHGRTNSWAGHKEKISYVDLSGKRLIVHYLAILIDKGEIGNLVVDGITVHYSFLTEDGQWPLFLNGGL
jgi:hypothetical protein